MDQSLAWEKIHTEKGWLSSPGIEFLAFMAEHYWSKSDLKFLDLGCGVGASTLFLAKKGFKVTSIDFSETACRNLINNLANNEKSNIDVVNCDVLHFDIDSESIDCVLLVNLIDCLEPIEAELLLGKIRKWLKRDGRVFATVLHSVPDDYETNNPIRLYKTTEELRRIFTGYVGQLRVITTYVNNLQHPVTNWMLDMHLM